MWFILAVFAGFLFSTNRLLIRSMLRKGGNSIAFMAIHNAAAGLLLLPIALYHPVIPDNPGSWFVLVLAFVAFFLGDLCAFLSLERIEASVYQILGQVRHIIVLIGGFLLFNELITSGKVISIVLLMLGVIIALVEKSRVELSRGVLFGVASPIFISLGFLAIKQISNDVSTGVSAAFVLTASGALAYGMLFARSQWHDRAVSKKNFKILLFAAALFSLFELVLFTALDLGEASKVTPVVQSSLLFTLIGGYLFLNERERLIQKIIGSLLIIAGIVLIFFS